MLNGSSSESSRIAYSSGRFSWSVAMRMVARSASPSNTPMAIEVLPMSMARRREAAMRLSRECPHVAGDWAAIMAQAPRSTRVVLRFWKFGMDST